MASFTAGTTFSDGVANDVTAAKLGALITDATPTSGFIQDRTLETITATNDTLLIGDASDSNNLKRITVANFAQTLPTAKVTTGTIDTGTFGTTTSTAGSVTTGTIVTGTFGTTTSTAATITTGTIPTLVSTTLVTTGTGTAAAPAIVPTGDTNTGFFFPAADTLAATTQGTERGRIDSSGKVLIGTTSNDTGGRLEVKQASGETGIGIQSSGTDDSKLYFRTASGTYGGDISFNGSYVKVSAGTTERLRIDSSGNLLVGTTDSALSSGVGYKFQASATLPRMGIVLNTAVADSNYHLYNLNATNNGYRFYVNNNGGVANYSGNNVNLSDERRKTDIQNAGNYLEKISQIPVRTFLYKDQGDDTEKTIGVIAQEVEPIIPELVNNEGFGETPEDGIPLKTIYQTDFQYVLMRCIQELKAENDSLKSRVTALEAA
ncbi:MAG: tail fiber domain-containing protein [Caulobacteraceae bacterium]|nr:tail fiber domain-containing protein [Caulobacteraceae bacterium]